MMSTNIINELQCKKAYLLTCALNNAHLCSLVRDFVVPWVTVASLAIQNELSKDADPKFCWAHMSKGTFSAVAAHTQIRDLTLVLLNKLRCHADF